MADLTITTTAVVFVSGTKEVKDAAETVTAGDWLYLATGTTVGVATNDHADKNAVIGMALNDAAVGQPVSYAKDGSIVDLGAILTAVTWYVLSADGGTSPVADQATSDYVSLVGYGIDGTQLQIKLVNTGTQAP